MVNKNLSGLGSWAKYFSIWPGDDDGQTYLVPAVPTETNYTVTSYYNPKPFYYHSRNGKRWK